VLGVVHGAIGGITHDDDLAAAKRRDERREQVTGPVEAGQQHQLHFSGRRE
jgi:hypothetical protein